MIRKPLTTITINNDPTANALKPGTQQLIKGIKGQHEAGQKIAKAFGGAIGVEPSKGIYERGSWVRRKTAQMQKMHKAKSGSKARREFLKTFANG